MSNKINGRLSKLEEVTEQRRHRELQAAARAHQEALGRFSMDELRLIDKAAAKLLSGGLLALDESEIWSRWAEEGGLAAEQRMETLFPAWALDDLDRLYESGERLNDPAVAPKGFEALHRFILTFWF